MRYFAFRTDPTAGGSDYDDVIATPAILSDPPVEAVPVTTSQADPGEQRLTRNAENRGRRAGMPDVTFAARPSMSFEALALPRIVRAFLPRGMGGAIANAGVAPASVKSTIQMAQANPLPAVIGTLVREEEVDRMTGLVVNELGFNFPADEWGTISLDLRGKYHDVDETVDVVGLPNFTGLASYNKEPFMLRDITAIMGDGVGVALDCLGGFGFTLNNALSEDLRVTHCAGKNVREVVIDGTLHKLWYPDRHRIGMQSVTGRYDFGGVKPDRELRRILGHAEKLVVELWGDPLGTTPAADEAVRLIFHKQVPTGGGPEPLSRDGEQMSSYEFTASLDVTTAKDLEAEVVGTSAVNVPSLIG